MALELLKLVVGLALLLWGGHAAVTGASRIARRMGVPPLFIGLTVIAFGTSAPELTVNVFAALKGSGELAFGNVFGSNLANIGLVAGVAALFTPLAMGGPISTRELPMMFLAAVLAFVVGLDFFSQRPLAEFDRGEGIVLLACFCAFLYYVLRSFRREPDGPSEAQVRVDDVPTGTRILRASLFTLAGLVALVAGGRFAVDGAIDVAAALGVPEVVVGLAVVSVGTSLPELVTAIIAARRGETEMAVGNVVGSNIFNTLLVCGSTSLILPVAVPRLGVYDLTMNLVLTLAFALGAILPGRRIGRIHGGLLLATYLVYLGWRSAAAGLAS